MRKLIFKLLIKFIILYVFILIGFPFEIENLWIDFLLKFTLFGMSFFIIYLGFKEVKKLENKIVRVIFRILISSFLVLFFLGLFTNNLFKTPGTPDWYNLEVYTNKKGHKILYQLKETSGSIWDYRERFVVYEFNDKNRISINWSSKYLKNKWKVYDVERDSIYYVDFK